MTKERRLAIKMWEEIGRLFGVIAWCEPKFEE